MSHGRWPHGRWPRGRWSIRAMAPRATVAGPMVPRAIASVRLEGARDRAGLLGERGGRPWGLRSLRNLRNEQLAQCPAPGVLPTRRDEQTRRLERGTVSACPVLCHPGNEQQIMSTLTTSSTRVTGTDVTALRILARTMVRELRQRGYGLRHVVTLATELIGLACESIRSDPQSTPGP